MREERGIGKRRGLEKGIGKKGIGKRRGLEKGIGKKGIGKRGKNLKRFCGFFNQRF